MNPELELYRRFFEQASDRAFFEFLSFLTKQPGPVADAARQILRDKSGSAPQNAPGSPVPANDDTGFEQDALGQAAALLGGEWLDEKRAREGRALLVAQDALDHLLDGQDRHYKIFEYNDAIFHLYELSKSYPAIDTARSALTRLGRRRGRRLPTRAKLEQAREAVTALLGGEWTE